MSVIPIKYVYTNNISILQTQKLDDFPRAHYHHDIV